MPPVLWWITAFCKHLCSQEFSIAGYLLRLRGNFVPLQILCPIKFCSCLYMFIRAAIVVQFQTFSQIKLCSRVSASCSLHPSFFSSLGSDLFLCNVNYADEAATTVGIQAHEVPRALSATDHESGPPDSKGESCWQSVLPFRNGQDASLLKGRWRKY